MKIMIREAESGDADATVALWHACDLTRPWNEPHADFQRALETIGSTVFLAWSQDGRLIGSVMTGYDGHRGWVYYLASAPDNRNKGTARRLLSAAEHWLAQRSCPKVELMVREGNPAAELYEHLGWELQSVRVYARWLNTRDARVS